jgi:hypothetical protein
MGKRKYITVNPAPDIQKRIKQKYPKIREVKLT